MAETPPIVWEQAWVPAEEYDRVRGLLLNIILADDDEFDGPGGAIDHARVHIDDVQFDGPEGGSDV